MEQLEGFRSKVLASLPDDEPLEGGEGGHDGVVVGAEILAKEGFFSVAGDVDEDVSSISPHSLHVSGRITSLSLHSRSYRTTWRTG